MVQVTARVRAGLVSSGSGTPVEEAVLVTRIDRRVEHILRLMKHGEPRSVAELAREVNLSESHLTRLFRRQIGSSPGRFYRDARLDRARELIVSSFKSIKEVMAAVGWSDPSHFCRDFKQRFGASPRALRLRVRG